MLPKKHYNGLNQTKPNRPSLFAELYMSFIIRCLFLMVGHLYLQSFICHLSSVACFSKSAIFICRALYVIYHPLLVSHGRPSLFAELYMSFIIRCLFLMVGHLYLQSFICHLSSVACFSWSAIFICRALYVIYHPLLVSHGRPSLFAELYMSFIIRCLFLMVGHLYLQSFICHLSSVACFSWSAIFICRALYVIYHPLLVSHGRPSLFAVLYMSFIIRCLFLMVGHLYLQCFICHLSSVACFSWSAIFICRALYVIYHPLLVSHGRPSLFAELYMSFIIRCLFLLIGHLYLQCFICHLSSVACFSWSAIFICRALYVIYHPLLVSHGRPSLFAELYMSFIIRCLFLMVGHLYLQSFICHLSSVACFSWSAIFICSALYVIYHPLLVSHGRPSLFAVLYMSFIIRCLFLMVGHLYLQSFICHLSSVACFSWSAIFICRALYVIYHPLLVSPDRPSLFAELYMSFIIRCLFLMVGHLYLQSFICHLSSVACFSWSAIFICRALYVIYHPLLVYHDRPSLFAELYMSFIIRCLFLMVGHLYLQSFICHLSSVACFSWSAIFICRALYVIYHPLLVSHGRPSLFAELYMSFIIRCLFLMVGHLYLQSFICHLSSVACFSWSAIFICRALYVIYHPLLVSHGRPSLFAELYMSFIIRCLFLMVGHLYLQITRSRTS